MRIHIAQPTEQECYGSDATAEDARTVAQNCLALAEEYARHHWPDASITTELVSHAMSVNSAADAPDGRPTCLGGRDWVTEQINDYISRHWTAEPLWEKAFDAKEYLAKYPR